MVHASSYVVAAQARYVEEKRMTSDILSDIRKALAKIEAVDYDYCGSKTMPHVASPKQPNFCTNCGQGWIV